MVGSKCDMQASLAQARARAHPQVCDREAEQAVARPSFPWNAIILVLHPRDPRDALISEEPFIQCSRCVIPGGGGIIPTSALVGAQVFASERCCDRGKNSHTAIKWHNTHRPSDPASGATLSVFHQHL